MVITAIIPTILLPNDLVKKLIIIDENWVIAATLSSIINKRKGLKQIKNNTVWLPVEAKYIEPKNIGIRTHIKYFRFSLIKCLNLIF